MKNWYTTGVFAFAILLGAMTTVMVTGCRKVPPPVDDQPLIPSTNTTEAANATTPMDPTEDEPSLEQPEAEAAEAPMATEEAPKQPAEETPTAEEPAAEEPAAEEPAAEEPAAEEPAADKTTQDTVAEIPGQLAAVDKSANAKIEPGDWAQWGGSSYRNNTPIGKNIPTSWAVGEFDRETREWISDEAKNIKWVARVGSQTYGNPVVAGGRLFIGTNNKSGWLPRYPSDVDLGCLIAFDENDGSFLWQDSSEKLPTGRVHDWPLQGICCAPYVEGDRVWYVTSRGEVKCLDAKGFYDDEDDGPVQSPLARIFDIRTNEDPEKDVVAPSVEALGKGNLPETVRSAFAERGEALSDEVEVSTVAAGKKWNIKAKVNDVERQFEVRLAGPNLSGFKVITPADKHEADVIWVYDMMSEQRVSQHNMCSCSVTALGDILFVNTSNGVDESHINCPSPDAPSFMAMDKNTGKVHWTDGSPGLNILHGQWSSPTVAMLGGVPQVIFAGGDGWVYSFRADEGKDGKPELLWKFDANPKESKWILGGRGTRNNIIATPVVYDGLVYVAVGQDPEHGEGIGHLWCLNPNKRGDVSSELAMKVEGDSRTQIPHRRLQAVEPENGEVAIDNENSAVIWHFSEFDRNGDGEIDFEETMHRSCGTVAIKDDLVFIADFSGLFHCLDAKSGKVHWAYDMLAAAWGSPLIVEDNVYIGDEDGDVSIFKLSADPKVAMKEVDGELMPVNADEYGDVINMGNSVYSTPIVANNVLFIANRTHVFAIAQPEGAE